MKKRSLLGIGAVVLAVSVLLVVWQGSFKMGSFAPTNPNQTFIFWAISILIFVLMVTLGFILFKELVKIYIARQSNREGSRIRTKLVVGALALSCMPVFCLVLFSFEVLSRSLDRWNTNPVDGQVKVFVNAATLLRKEMQDEVNAQAALLASKPEVRQALIGGAIPAGYLERFAKAQEAQSVAIFAPAASAPLAVWEEADAGKRSAQSLRCRFPVLDGTVVLGYVELASPMPLDVADQVATIDRFNRDYIVLRDALRWGRYLY